MKTLNVDLELVKKYNVAGPRYTSYPPATKFVDTIPWEQLSEKIEANNQSARDLSVYFHIPFCESLCWFCGCTTVITMGSVGATNSPVSRWMCVTKPSIVDFTVR